VSVREITIEELKLAISVGAKVIDVREADEYVSGHVPAATHVPLGTVPDNMELFRSDADVYVVCHSGGRSMRACEFLHDQGITNVVNVIGGTSGWIALGNPVATGQQS
jgi:rhodanese-related sulfurtransferase